MSGWKIRETYNAAAKEVFWLQSMHDIKNHFDGKVE